MTLSIGVLASMVSALVIARVLTDLALRAARRRPRRPALRHRRRRTGAHLAGGARPVPDEAAGRWIAVAAVVGVLAVAGIVVRGLNLGVEFTGGRLVEFSTSQQVNVATARAAVADAGFPRRGGAVLGGDGEDNVSVRTGRDHQRGGSRSRRHWRRWAAR